MTFQPHLPPGLEAVLARALEVDPEARYPNACAMVFDLRRIALSMGVGDGRYFLRKALEREWAQFAEEITAPHGRSTPTRDYEPAKAEVVPLPKRRR